MFHLTRTVQTIWDIDYWSTLEIEFVTAENVTKRVLLEHAPESIHGKKKDVVNDDTEELIVMIALLPMRISKTFETTLRLLNSSTVPFTLGSWFSNSQIQFHQFQPLKSWLHAKLLYQMPHIISWHGSCMEKIGPPVMPQRLLIKW